MAIQPPSHRIFSGRILFLATDAALMAAQLAGTDLAQPPALRDNISTDEITPLPSLVYFEDRLGGHAYTGFKAGDIASIGVSAVRAGASRSPSPAADTARAHRVNTPRSLNCAPAFAW